MRISGLQISWMIATFELGMTLLLTTSPAITAAKQDAWMSMIIAGIAAIFIAMIANKLCLLYPDKSFFEYTEVILGKWIGKIIITPYLIQLYLAIGIIFRQSSELIEMSLFHTTPLIFVVLLMLIPVIYITYVGGIEGIARFSELVGPVIYLTVIVTFIFCFNNLRWKNVLPIYADTGWPQILNGAIVPLGFMGEFVLIVKVSLFLFIASYGTAQFFHIKNWRKAIWYVAAVTITLTLIFPNIDAASNDFPKKFWIPYVVPINFVGIPLLLLAVGTVRNKLQR